MRVRARDTLARYDTTAYRPRRQPDRDRRTYMRLKALLATLVLATTGLLVTPAAAHANPVEYCYWFSGQQGSNSNCDNKGPFYAEDCEITGARDKELSVYIGNNVTVTLMYTYGGGGCRTVMARMHIDGIVPDGSNCYVKLARNSDGETLYTSRTTYGDSDQYQETNVLYDADTTSYAWGYCYRPNSGTVSGRTSNY
jgi:hypothetical protein